MWILIDANNWFARDFFAQGRTCPGTFVKRLRDVLADRKPDRCVLCWDSATSFRRDLCGSYKAGRGDKPDGFHETLAALHRELAAVDLPVESSEIPGFEADDLLASYARQAIDEGEQAMIFSADKDLHQAIVAGSVNQVLQVDRPSRSELRYRIMTAAKLVEQYRVAPHQWVDYRTLTGDPSDGIKGCVGVGPKAAVIVLRACGSLDVFYENPFLAHITPRQRTLLIAYRDQVPLARELLILRHDAIWQPAGSPWHPAAGNVPAKEAAS